MKKRSNWFRVSSLLLVLLTVLTVPLLYQNCGLIDGEVGFRRLPSEIGIQIRNGKGTVIANGGDLCLGAATDEESSSVVLSITTSPLTEVYYCRRPYLDNGVWNCNEARSLVSGGSEGVFRVLAAGDDGDRVLELSYENLPAGRYELEISAEGGSEGETPWTSVPVPVSFIVKDCTIATCADTDPSQNGPQQFSCPEGWSYKTSANSLTHPSQDRCCAPPATCLDTDPLQNGNQKFPCRGASVYNQSAATKTNPSDLVCCVCRPTYERRSQNYCRCPAGKEEHDGRCVNECRGDQTRNLSNGQCECRDDGKEEFKDRCVPACRDGWVRNLRGECECPSGKEEVLGQCEPECPEGQERNNSWECACPPPEKEVRGRCVLPCPEGGGHDQWPAGGCYCPENKVEFKGRCVPKCRGDQERNSEGQCACPDGQVAHENRCIAKSNCESNEKENGKGGCEACPDGQMRNFSKSTECTTITGPSIDWRGIYR